MVGEEGPEDWQLSFPAPQPTLGKFYPRVGQTVRTGTAGGIRRNLKQSTELPCLGHCEKTTDLPDQGRQISPNTSRGKQTADETEIKQADPRKGGQGKLAKTLPSPGGPEGRSMCKAAPAHETGQVLVSL